MIYDQILLGLLALLVVGSGIYVLGKRRKKYLGKENKGE